MESNQKQLAQSAPAGREEEGINLSRYQLNLWNNLALVNDPELSLSWTRKGSPQSDSMTSGSRLVIYTLDNAGNRTNVNDAGVSKSYMPNNLNEYTTADGIGVSNGTSHEISSYNNTSYNYIADTYLSKATAGNNSYTLYYDALGRCVKRTSVINGGTATTNYYIFDGEHWVMEYDANGVLTGSALYGRGVDELIARNNNGQGQWFFPDRNGNISAVTDSLNTIRESYRYDAFGLPTVFGPDGLPNVPPTESEIGNKFMFTGREWNSTFGFYEYRARAYNPTIGRFMSEDPKGFDAGDYNLYRYCGNDPLDRVDPTGLDVNLDMFSSEQSRQNSLNLGPLPLVPDRFTVGAHGNPSSLLNSRGKQFDKQGIFLKAGALSRAMAEAGYKHGTQVVLYACYAGAGKDPIAQHLADKLGSTVWAPDDVLWSWKSGRLFVGPRLSNTKTLPDGRPNPKYNEPDTSKPGGFRRFDPESEIPERRMDSLIPQYSHSNKTSE